MDRNPPYEFQRRSELEILSKPYTRDAVKKGMVQGIGTGCSTYGPVWRKPQNSFTEKNLHKDLCKVTSLGRGKDNIQIKEIG